MILSSAIVPTLSGNEVSPVDYFYIHTAFEAKIAEAIRHKSTVVNISSTEKNDLMAFYFIALRPAIKVWFADEEGKVASRLIFLDKDEEYTYTKEVKDKLSSLVSEKGEAIYQIPIARQIGDGMKEDLQDGLYYRSDIASELRKNHSPLEGLSIFIDGSTEVKNKDILLSYYHQTISKVRLENLIQKEEQSNPFPKGTPKVGFIHVTHRTSGANTGIVGEVYVHDGSGTIYLFSLGRKMNAGDLSVVKEKISGFFTQNGMKVATKVKAMVFETEEELVLNTLTLLPTIATVILHEDEASSVKGLEKRFVEILTRHIHTTYEKDDTGRYVRLLTDSSMYNIPREVDAIVDLFLSRGVTEVSDELIRRVRHGILGQLAPVISIDYGYMFERWDKHIKVKEESSIPYLAKELFGIKVLPEAPLDITLFNSRIAEMLYPVGVLLCSFVKVEERLQLTKILFDQANYVRVSPRDVLSSRSIVYSLLSRGLYEKGKVLIKDGYTHQTKPLVGGLLTEPAKGLHRGVVMYDFTAMYPTIVRQFNISPDTLLYRVNGLNDKGCELDASAGVPYSPKVVKNAISSHTEAPQDAIYTASGSLFSSKEKGALPLIMETLHRRRRDAQKKIAEIDERIKELTKQHP